MVDLARTGFDLKSIHAAARRLRVHEREGVGRRQQRVGWRGRGHLPMCQLMVRTYREQADDSDFVHDFEPGVVFVVQQLLIAICCCEFTHTANHFTPVPHSWLGS